MQPASVRYLSIPVPDLAPFVQYGTGSDIGVLFQSSKRLTVPGKSGICMKVLRGTSLHVYTADDRKANTLNVQTAGDGKAYTLHVHTVGGG